MCYNCGCGNPNDDMGSMNNITNQMLSQLANNQNKSLEEIKRMVLQTLMDDKVDSNQALKEMFENAAKAWGQSVDDAKNQALRMLKRELVEG
ncbi:hypothetical protein HYS91_05000 [Candidatus Daviesbacteria bacterium]|nr:hypothetical protein [Candidatus Daviesbacteria bacterium]